MLRAGVDVAVSQLAPAEQARLISIKLMHDASGGESPFFLQKKQLFRESPESATPMMELCSDTVEKTFEGLGWFAANV